MLLIYLVSSSLVALFVVVCRAVCARLRMQRNGIFVYYTRCAGCFYLAVCDHNDYAFYIHSVGLFLPLGLMPSGTETRVCWLPWLGYVQENNAKTFRHRLANKLANANLCSRNGKYEGGTEPSPRFAPLIGSAVAAEPPWARCDFSIWAVL